MNRLVIKKLDMKINVNIFSIKNSFFISSPYDKV